MTTPHSSLLRRASMAGVAVLALAGLAACSSDTTDRDESTGEITAAATASVYDLKVGDCLDYDSMSGASISEAGTIPCGDPHDVEIYAEWEMPKGDYPTDLQDQADDYCHGEFANFVGIAYEESTIDFFSLTPSASGWSQDDDRIVQCMAVSVDMETGDPVDVTGSLKGAAY